MDAVKSYVTKTKELMYAWYFQVSIASALYMMDPTEKVVINVVAVALLALLLYAIVTFFPGHIFMMANFLVNRLSNIDAEEQATP